MPDTNTRDDERDDSTTTTTNDPASNLLTTDDSDTETRAKDSPHQGRIDTGGYVPTS